MTPDSDRILIIGGGISGLATAFYLRKYGIRSTIVEASGRLGGLIGTAQVQGCELEVGPDSFIATKPAVARLAGELGIADRLMGSNDAGRRIFVVRNRKLVEMPRGMVMMVPSEWAAVLSSPLFGWGTKVRFLLEWWRRPKTRPGDFSIRELVAGHFGEEALQYITEPLLSGVYGGDAASLSAQSVLPKFVEYEQRQGSLIRGVRLAKSIGKSGTSGTVPAEGNAKGLFLSFAGGMQTLTDALQEAVQDSTEFCYGRALSVGRNGAEWQVELDSTFLRATQLVLACGAHQSARLIQDEAPDLAGQLEAIPYSSSLLVTFLFDRRTFSHPLNGFGFLVPPPERKSIAAVTWINTKFPSRVAPGLVAIRAFLVDPEAERYMNNSDNEISGMVLRDLLSLMQVDAAPVHRQVQRWPKSMPQYVVGHGERVARIRELLANCRGLALVGNYLDGIGIPDCVRNGESTAADIAKIKNSSSSG